MTRRAVARRGEHPAMARARISLAKSGDTGAAVIDASRLVACEQRPPAPALLALARLLARQAAREARACNTDAR